MEWINPRGGLNAKHDFSNNLQGGCLQAEQRPNCAPETETHEAVIRIATDGVARLLFC
jgi:hypothetical protein